MDARKRLQIIEKKHKRSSTVGGILTIAGMTKTVKKNKILSMACLAGGAYCSISSFSTYVQSLEKYGLIEDVDPSKIILGIIKNIVVIPIIDSTMISRSLADLTKDKRQW